jgi:predicted RNase H-like HicB family nuclease
MQIPVLIEPLETNGYRATTGLPLVVSAEGATREEALLHVQEALQTRLSEGAEIAPLEVPLQHPLARFAGMFKDNPLFDEWQQAIADYRQQVEDDPER